jgi:hypothetical protein
MRFNPNPDSGCGGHRPIALNVQEAVRMAGEPLTVCLPGLKDVVPVRPGRDTSEPTVRTRTRAGLQRNRESRCAQARTHCKSHPLTCQG